jgi:hypothetical protein
MTMMRPFGLVGGKWVRTTDPSLLRHTRLSRNICHLGKVLRGVSADPAVAVHVQQRL